MENICQEMSTYLKDDEGHYPSDSRRQINANVILGMPSKQCRYHGICKIEPIESSKVSFFRCNHAKTVQVLLYLDDTMDLCIRFMLDSMTEYVKNEYFGASYFTVLETVNTPTFVNQFLGKRFTVNEGKYLFRKENEYYEITVPQVINIHKSDL